MVKSNLRKVMVTELECRTCVEKKRKDKTWFPRINKKTGKVIVPKNCPNPKCKSPYWNKEYSRK